MIYLSNSIVQSILWFFASTTPFLLTLPLTSISPIVYSLPKIFITFSVVVSQSKYLESTFIFKYVPTLALSLLKTASSAFEKSNLTLIFPVESSFLYIASQILSCVFESITGETHSVCDSCSPANFILSPRSNST